MAKRAKIGDIVEILTSRGFAYVQYTHHDPTHGSLVRVLPGIFDKRPQSFDALARQRARFVAFVPLGKAISQKVFSVVARAPIPEDAQKFPLFRAGAVSPSGRVKTWWLWDGKKEWPVGDLSPEQETLPFRSIWNDTLLIERIESGWVPGNE